MTYGFLLRQKQEVFEIQKYANKSRSQYSPFLTEQAWSTKNFYCMTKPRRPYFRWSQKVISILAFRVANDSQRFGVSCPGAQKTSLTLLTGTGELGPWEKYTGVTVTNKVEEKQYS